MNPTLVKICAEILEIDSDQLNTESSAENISNWDSLKHWEIISEVEEAFEVSFTMDEAVGFQKLGDIQACLDQKKAGTS